MNGEEGKDEAKDIWRTRHSENLRTSMPTRKLLPLPSLHAAKGEGLRRRSYESMYDRLRPPTGTFQRQLVSPKSAWGALGANEGFCHISWNCVGTSRQSSYSRSLPTDGEGRQTALEGEPPASQQKIPILFSYWLDYTLQRHSFTSSPELVLVVQPTLALAQPLLFVVAAWLWLPL
jgi:hypothetical protein